MGRTPNHRFSVTKNRTVTPFESVLDSIKRSFTSTGQREAFLYHKSPDLLYSMGNKSKKRQDRFDLGDSADDYHHEAESTKLSNSNRRLGRGRNEVWTSTIANIRHDDEAYEDREPSDAQSDSEFDPYLALVEDLKLKLEASRTAADDALVFYTQHQLEIQMVDTTRQQLDEMTKKCDEYKIVISRLRELEGEKEQELAKKKAAIEKDRKELDALKDEEARRVQQLAKEKSEFEDMMRIKEEEQLLKLQEENAKLASEYNKQYTKREEDLQKAVKKSQDDDRKKASDLQITNDKLMQDLEEQKRKLKDTEKRCRDMETLRDVSDNKVEDLSQKLKMAENEFGLSANSTEYFEREFLKIHVDVRAISLRYVEQMKADDLEAAVHDKIVEIDTDFTSVPISNSIVSKELCLVHFQRVISSQLQAILWQPFSSEETVQDSKLTPLLNKIYDWLAKSSHEGKSGLRAARTYAALTMRSLHSQSTSTIRAEIFTDNIMKVLSLLLNPKMHEALQKDLTHLATSAISLWSIAQSDERELHAHLTLDPPNFEKPEGDNDITDSRVFVMFPCVTARSCPQIGDARPAGPPGGWVDSKPEVQFEEIYIHKGAGIPEWEQVVRAGEDEEEDRRRKQEIETHEKKMRELQDEMEKLKPELGHKRVNSFPRRNSVVGGKSTPPSSPTSTWLGAQKIPERE